MVNTVLPKEIKIPDPLTPRSKMIDNDQGRGGNVFISNKPIDFTKRINLPEPRVEQPVREIIVIYDKPPVQQELLFIPEQPSVEQLPIVDEPVQIYEEPQPILLYEEPVVAEPMEERGNDPIDEPANVDPLEGQHDINPDYIDADSFPVILRQPEEENPSHPSPNLNRSLFLPNKEESGSHQSLQSSLKNGNSAASRFSTDPGSQASSSGNPSQRNSPPGFQGANTNSELPASKDSPAAKTMGNNSSANSSSRTALGMTDLNRYITNGQLKSWGDVRKCFSQMLQKTALLQSQNLPYRVLTPSHFLLDSQGKVSIRNSQQPLQSGTQQNLSSSIYAGPHSESHEKDHAFNLGLILVQMCTGKDPNEINTMTGKTAREEIMDGHISLPSDTPKDVKQIIAGLLQINPQQRLEVNNALMMLNVNPAIKSSPALPQPLSYSQLTGTAPAQRSSAHEVSHSIVLPLPSSTLLLSNSSTMSKQTPSEKSKEEEEEDENGPSIEAVLFGSEDILMAGHLIDSELLSLIDALKKNTIRTNLIAHNDDNHNNEWKSLFDLCLSSSKIGLDKPDWKAYDALLQAIDLPAKEILYIHRDPARVKAAKIMGFDAIVFTSATQLKEELSKRNLLQKREKSLNFQDQRSLKTSY